ncbi:MAG: rRNA maturation RNase YbeY [Rickettsiales bacterium]
MTITILTHDPRWSGLAPTVRRAAEAALAQKRVKRAALNIVLSDDDEVKALNNQYRGKNKSTNVLSFPNGEVEEGVKQLGDIILAFETILAEAAQQGKKLKAHVTHLTIHGVLHLLGHDHEDEREAETMEAIEIKILASMGIANPYESA